MSTQAFCNENFTFEYLNELRIIQVNVRSIRSFERFDHFRIFIDQFLDKIDIVFTTETWQNCVHLQCYHMKGFKKYFSGRNCVDLFIYLFYFGGCTVYLKNDPNVIF